jgi:signal-transduction protein with cAMP-binding, CBS, and nucleotidyltransferase domain
MCEFPETTYLLLKDTVVYIIKKIQFKERLQRVATFRGSFKNSVAKRVAVHQGNECKYE